MSLPARFNLRAGRLASKLFDRHKWCHVLLPSVHDNRKVPASGKGRDVRQLIHALTPAEQRTFHHIAQRHTGQRPMGYFELYEILRRQDRFDEAAAREATGLKKSHFAVIKRQLYEQLMQALSYHYRQDHDLEKGRPLLQQTRILLEKDLVGQAEKRLWKARKLIEAHQLTALQTECLLLRKAILEKRLNQPGARQTLNALQKDWKSAMTALNLAGEAAIASLELALQHLQKIRAQGSQEGYSPNAAMDRPAFREALQAPQWTTQLDARRALSTYHFMNAEPAAAFAQNEALLQLMIHFDLQHFELLPYLLQSFRRSHTGFYPESTGLFLLYLPQLLNAAGPRERLQTRNEWRSAIEHASLEDRKSRFYEYLDLFYWMDNPVH